MSILEQKKSDSNRCNLLNSSIDKLVQVKNVFLLDYPLVFSLLKPRIVGYFGTKKKSDPNRSNPLNSSIK